MFASPAKRKVWSGFSIEVFLTLAGSFYFYPMYELRDCAIIIRGGGAEILELSSKNLDSTPPPSKAKKLVLAPPLLC